MLGPGHGGDGGVLEQVEGDKGRAYVIPRGSLRQSAIAARAPALAPHTIVPGVRGAYSLRQEATPTW